MKYLKSRTNLVRFLIFAIYSPNVLTPSGPISFLLDKKIDINIPTEIT